MIKKIACYYVVCDTCGRESDTYHWDDQASAIGHARDYNEWFVTHDGVALCDTDDPAHREQARKNLALFDADELEALLDFYPELLTETNPS